MRYASIAALIMAAVALVFGRPTEKAAIPNLYPFPNPSGQSATFTSAGTIDLTNPFFQDLGTNGRACVTCHQPDQGWSVAADKVQQRFDATDGLDPIFRTNDGSNCDHDIDTTTTSDRAQAYSLLRTRGLIRVAIDVPADAEFDITKVKNPYGCSDTSTISMYRRPLPSTNLRALSTVMW